MAEFSRPVTRALAGPTAWLSTLIAMSRKELTIMVRYPVEFVASFSRTFLIIMVFTLASLMFSEGDVGGRTAEAHSATAGLMVYGFVLFTFLSDTLWNIGFNVRREQNQGTLEQLYLSPASKSASLISRVTVSLVWTGLLSVASVSLMSVLVGNLALDNLPLGLFTLIMTLSGTFGMGFAFAALTLRVRDTAHTLANMLQLAFIVLCAPFFPFAALPSWVQVVSRIIPLAYGVDLFRSTLMGYPAGFPELAPSGVEVVVVVVFGLLMPPLGFWLYRRAEDQARQKGSLGEY